MYNDERQSTRSPTTSRANSYGDGPASRTNGRAYQSRSSVNEENEREDNEYEEASVDNDESARNNRPPQRSEDQYIAALRYRFPNRPKTDYAYSRPAGPAIPPAPPLPSTTQSPSTTTTATPGGTTTTTPRSGPYQSSVRPAIGGTNTPDTSDNRAFPRPALRRVTPDQQNTYARRTTSGDPTPTPTPTPTPAVSASQSGPTPTPFRPNVRINEPNIDLNRPLPSTFTRQTEPPRTQESIFEKVPSHGGPVSYLGTGTFSQFEHCLQECLERERRQTGLASHIMRHDIPSNISALEYGYDPLVTPSSPYQGLEPTTVHQFIDYPSRPTATFSIDDVRHINVALSRSGISLFPHHRSYYDSYSSPIPMISSPYPNRRRIIGEVVSACRVVEEDPAMLFSRNGPQAVQNVWNAIQNHQPFSYMSNASSRGPYNI